MKILPEDVGVKKVWLLFLLAVFLFLGFGVLSEIFWTIFLAAAFSYVLHPFKKRLDDYNLSDRQSAAIVTFVSFFSVILLITPILLVLFNRRQILVDFLAALPDKITVGVFELGYTIQTSRLEVLARDWLTNTAIQIAQDLPSLSIKLFLFVFVLYAILRHASSLEENIVAIAPNKAEDVINSYHDRVEKTIVGIFAVQMLTAILTFILALPVFYFLGYKAFLSLAVVCGLLQFIPIVGPAFIILSMAALELTAGLPVKALMILVFGLVIIGFLPDAYLKPKLADRATGLPASLYFVGFAGGALTLGAVGVLAGPLLIALILETAELLTE